MSSPPRLLFVGGCERSGTTLAQKVLAAHSRVAAGPELVFTWRIADLYRRMGASYPEAYARRRAELYDRRRLGAAFRGLVRELLAPVAARKPEALWLAEKTPSNIAVAGVLLQLFPDARFVHLLRDGRDVLASHREVGRRLERAGERYHRPGFRLTAVCGRWNRACDEHFARTGDPSQAGRYHLLRYEELVTQPQRAVAGLFSFLELEPEPRTLRPEEVPAAELGVPVDGAWHTDSADRSGFDPRPVGRWRRDLGLAGRLFGQLLMAANLRRTGYPVAAAYVAAARGPLGAR